MYLWAKWKVYLAGTLKRQSQTSEGKQNNENKKVCLKVGEGGGRGGGKDKERIKNIPFSSMAIIQD